jgi:hypothetical protein
MGKERGERNPAPVVSAFFTFTAKTQEDTIASKHARIVHVIARVE